MGDGSSSHGMGYGITNVTANGFDFFLQTGGRSGVKLESTNVTIVALDKVTIWKIYDRNLLDISYAKELIDKTRQKRL